MKAINFVAQTLSFIVDCPPLYGKVEIITKFSNVVDMVIGKRFKKKLLASILKLTLLMNHYIHDSHLPYS